MVGTTALSKACPVHDNNENLRHHDDNNGNNPQNAYTSFARVRDLPPQITPSSLYTKLIRILR
eukprot:64414-Alexandrium_andersonii.AAC.1